MCCYTIYKMDDNTQTCCNKTITLIFLRGIFIKRSYCNECDTYYGREDLVPTCHSPSAMKRWCLLDLPSEYGSRYEFKYGTELHNQFITLMNFVNVPYTIRVKSNVYEIAEIVDKHLPLLEKFPESAEWKYVQEHREHLMKTIAKWKLMDALWKSMDEMSTEAVSKLSQMPFEEHMKNLIIPCVPENEAMEDDMIVVETQIEKV